MSFLDNITSKIPFVKKAQTSQYFFALNISLTQVTALLWELNGNRLDILGQSTLEHLGSEDLLEKANLALDHSLGALEIEPEKVLFGVPDSWNVDDNLKESYAKLLKKMVTEYDLEPMAYVTTTHAISHFLSKQDGLPPTVVLIGVGDYVEATLFKGGKVVENRLIKRSDHIGDDVEKTLAQFSEVEVLPSKMLIYSTKQDQNLDRIKEELMSFPWMQKLPFLHFPKIDILEESVPSEAIVLAGATELNPDVEFKKSFGSLKSDRGLINKHLIKDRLDLGRAVSNLAGVAADEDLGFVSGDIKNKPLSDEDDNLVVPDLEDESFVPASKVSTLPPAYRKIPSHLAPSHHQPLPTNMRSDHLTHEHHEAHVPADIYGGVEAVEKKVLSLEHSLVVPIKSFLAKGKRWNHLVFSPLGLIPVVLLFGALAYVFLMKAEVIIYVEPKVLEKSADVVADPEVSEVNEADKVIPAEIIKTSIQGSSKLDATGKKEIGDPARGQVIVYNKTDSSKSFSQGTVLNGPNGLKFTLDSNVTIASMSAVEGGIVYGKSGVAVTASAIGPDSNLSVGTELELAQLPSSTYSAKVDQALSGGTSKSVTIVTADDQKKLKSQILEELKQKAKTELEGKVEGDKKIITDALSEVSSKYTFSKAVNDQAKDFTVEANIEFKGTAYSDSDLKKIVAKLVETNVPEGFVFNPAETETLADISKIEDDGRLIFLAKFKAKLMPKLNELEIKEKIKGKRVSEIGEILKGLDHVIASEVKLIPGAPPPLDRLPFLGKNITITITPK